MRPSLMRLLAIALFLLFFVTGYVYAQEPLCPKDNLDVCNQTINKLQVKLDQLRTEKNTLSNKISYYNSQIQLTTLQIQQTEIQIASLSKQITDLESRLTRLSELFRRRTVEGYRLTVEMEPLTLLLASDNLSNFMTQLEYLRTIRLNDRKLMLQVEETRSNYDGQRTFAQLLARRLETQKQSLDQSKKEKEYLLQVTGNEEKRYQDMLSRALAEYEAIQAVFSGKGKESIVGEIKEGQRIASIISKESCNSDGAHLHFTVKDSQSNNTHNPFGYLRGGINYINCSGSSCGSSDGDAFAPGGNWLWPIDAPIKFTQGYGSTWATRNDPIIKSLYSFHDGIDIMSNSSSEVKAVKTGVLYRGAFTVRSGCQLRYVKVKHAEANIETYYFHVNY